MKTRIYLDHNATTGLLPAAKDAVLKVMDLVGNPSSIHTEGRDLRYFIETARKEIATVIDCHPSEICFTSSGAEANNTVIKGVFETFKTRGKHIISSPIEHSSLLGALDVITKQGAEVTYLPVDKNGAVSADDLIAAIRPDTILISLMMVNNELGTITDIQKMAAIAKQKNIFFHSDAVQALGKLPISVKTLGVDAMTFSGHKVGALKGVGVLYGRQGIKFERLIHGGHQESGHRAGTENAVGIVSFGKAIQAVSQTMESDNERMRTCRDHLEKRILSEIAGTAINAENTPRVSNTTNISFAGVEGESLLLNLDIEDIAVSAGSACSAGTLEPSHVLLALGLTRKQALGSIRFSLGKTTTLGEIDQTVDIVKHVVNRLRKK